MIQKEKISKNAKQQELIYADEPSGRKDSNPRCPVPKTGAIGQTTRRPGELTNPLLSLSKLT